jgi:uncharacterized membrane protein
MAQTRESLSHAEDAIAVQQQGGERDQRGLLPLLYRAQDALSRVLSRWVLCLAIGATALGLDLYRLGEPSMWFDEILSVERAQQPLSILWRVIVDTQPNMALYYVFLHFWLQFTALFALPASEAVVRFPSAIFAAASSVLVFLLGQRFFGRVAGVLAAGLYLLNDLQLVYAQQTRSYGLQLFLLCLSWYALFAALTTKAKSRQKLWWVCYVATMVLAVYTHLFSLLVFGAQLIAIGGLFFLPGPWRVKTRVRLRPLLYSLGSTGILIIPMLIATRIGGRTGWIPIPHLSDIYHLFLTISAQSKIYLAAIVVCVLFGLFTTVLSFRSRWPRPLATILRGDADDHPIGLHRYLPLGFALCCWLVVPIIVSYVVSQKSTHLFLSRYLVVVVPPLFLLVGMGIAVLRWRLLKVVLTLCLLLLALHYVPLYYETAQVEDWRTPSQWLVQHYQADDGMVCYDNTQGCQVSMEYYLRLYKSSAQFTPDSPGSFNWVTYDITNRPGNSLAAVDPHALALYAEKHSRLFFIVARLSGNQSVARVQVAQQWLSSHYRLIGQFSNTTVTIRLYLTNKGIITT